MKHSNFSNESVHCHSCPINNLCIAAMLNEDEQSRFDQIVQHPKPLQKSEPLFYAGEKLTYIYAIRTGSIKTFSISQDGEEQITGFHQAGELIGIDALARKKHHSFAKALETTEVCAIPYEQLDALAQTIPQLHTQLMNVMSNEIAKQYDIMLNLNQRSADQRLANFLINLGNTTSKQRADEINLHMTRGEIGNHLGLALETVSRLFSKFKQSNIIELKCKQVKIVDLPKLKKIAGIAEDDDIAAMAA